MGAGPPHCLRRSWNKHVRGEKCTLAGPSAAARLFLELSECAVGKGDCPGHYPHPGTQYPTPTLRRGELYLDSWFLVHGLLALG